MGAVIEFFVECLELIIGGGRRRHQSQGARNVDIGFRLFGAAIFIALVVAIFVFWATIVSVAIIAFWIAVALGLVIGVVKFLAD
jgi:uncharacterized membrane protein